MTTLPAPSRPRGAGRAGVLLAVVSLALGLWVSRPLVLDWRDALPHTSRGGGPRATVTRAPGDGLQLYYHLWLVRDALLGPTPAFVDPYQFRVDGPRWNLPQSFFPLSLPFVLLGLPGPEAGYNLLVWLSFPAAALGAYLLALRATGGVLAAVVAGLAYTLMPARLGPLFGGHAGGFAAGLAPLVLWGLDAALVDGSAAGGLAGGTALLSIAMLDPHHAYLLGGLVVAYALIRGTCGGGRLPGRLPARALVWFVVPAAAGVVWLWLLRQAFLVGSVAAGGRSLGLVRLYSPGPASLLLPETYGGAVVLLLATAGLVRGEAATWRLRLFYGVTFLAGLILSLGPTLPWLPLYQGLHAGLPLFDLIRNPQKFRLLTSMAGAILAAYGTVAVLARIPGDRARRGTGLLLAVAVLLETPPWHGIRVIRFLDSPVYQTVRDQARKVLYLPLWSGDSVWSSVYLYVTTRTRVPMLNGYSPLVSRRYVEEVYEPLRGLNVGHVGPGERAALHRLGVTHLVVDRALFPAEVSLFPSGFTVERLRTAPDLVLAQAEDPLWLFRVVDGTPPAAPAATSPVGLFFEAESLFRQTGALEADRRASGGRAVVARPGASAEGFLTFGPYRLLPGGRFQAMFRVRGRGLAVEVTTDDGRTRLAGRVVPPVADWAEERLAFELSEARPVEFRVHWDGQAPAAVDWVAAAFADRPDPEPAYEVEDLPHRLMERQDPGASGGRAGYLDPTAGRGEIVSGPTRRYPAGRYRLALRARLDAAPAGPLLRLGVAEADGRAVASRVVESGEIPVGRYGEVWLDFALPEPAVLVFPVHALSRAGLYLDRLDVRRRPAGDVSTPAPGAAR